MKLHPTDVTIVRDTASDEVIAYVYVRWHKDGTTVIVTPDPDRTVRCSVEALEALLDEAGYVKGE